MGKQDYNYIFTTHKTMNEAFDAINSVQEWWASDFEGSMQKLDDVFTVHFGEVSVTFKVVELVPYKKIVWLVTDCYLAWIKDIKEWKDTRISWEISTVKNVTQISMTHIGLIPGMECYPDCNSGWDFHIGKSLVKLINEGVGIPDVNTLE